MYRRDRNFLRFLKTGCLIYGFWPLNSDAGRWKRFSFEVLYLLVYAYQLYAIAATIHGLSCCYHSVSHFVKSIADIIFASETLYNWVYVRRRKKNFRLLLTRMEHFFNTTNVNLRQPIIACFILMTAFVFGTVLYGIVPFFIEKQMTPLTTVYFALPTDKQWGQNITFILNVFIIANASSILFVDMLVIFIMWHVACKFSLLGRRFTISSEGKLKLWIRQHQDTLRYANEINSTIALLVVKSTIAVGLNMILGALVIVRSHNFIELVKFITLTIFSVLRFVICSWAADTMTENANGIAWKIYDSPWTYTSPRIRRMALLIIQRCQKPVAIHATGFLSSWNLKFCGQVLYTNATYLMTLRAVIRE